MKSDPDKKDSDDIIVINEMSDHPASPSTTIHPTNDALNLITNYYLSQNPSIGSNKFKYGLLFVISGTSMWLFYTTGGQAANGNKTLETELISSAMIINFFVTWNTSEAFLNYIENKRFPAELSNFVDIKKINQDKAKITAISSIAFLNAAPVALAVFTNVNKLNAGAIIEAIITQIDNTFIHTFPTLIVAENIILRNIFLLPFLPIIAIGYSVKLMHNFLLTKEEKNWRKYREKIEKNHTILKNALIKTLETAQLNIQKNNLQFEWAWRNGLKSFFNPRFKIQLDNDLDFKNQDGIHNLIRIAKKASLVEKAAITSYSQNAMHFIFDYGMGVAFYSMGTILINAAIAGFYKNIYDDFSWLNNKEGQLAATLYPNMLLSVLVSYFAARFFRHILYEGIIATPIKFTWQALRHTCTGAPITVDPFPTSFKRYPKTTGFLILLAYYFARNSYGTALELINSHFKEPTFDEIRPILVFCAVYGMPIFNYKNAIEFILDKAVSFAGTLGGNDNKASVILDGKIQAIKNFIAHIKGEDLIMSLLLRKPEERAILLRITEGQFQELINNDTIPNKISAKRYGLFFEGKEKSPLLVEASMEKNPQINRKKVSRCGIV